MTNKHHWAYCTCGWITFAANESFAEQLVRRHLLTRPSCGVTFSRQTPEERHRDLEQQRRAAQDRHQWACELDLDLDLDLVLDPECDLVDTSGVPAEVQDAPTAHYPNSRR